MVQAYPYILIIHLSCAIFFIGYLFVDIFILNIVGGKIKIHHRKIKIHFLV